MKKIIYLIFILGLTSCFNQKKEKNSIVTIYEKDSLEIQKLIRNVYEWKEKTPQLNSCFNIGLLKENKYIGIDWKKYDEIAELFKNSGYFSSEFIKSYKETVKYLDDKIKKSSWNLGELPPFGTGANEWCHCQDYPTENYWNNIEIQDIKLKNNKISLLWNWGKDSNFKWLNDKKGYPFEVVKQNGKWKILSLDGFKRKYYE